MNLSSVICGGINFEKAPVELRERVAFRENQLPDALRLLREKLRLEETVLISTCNRVEYFGITSHPRESAVAWPEFLRSFHQISDDFSSVLFHFEGEAAVDHLFQMAAGLKSMVVGETEIFGQLKEAYHVAQHQGATGKHLNRLFQASFAAGKAVRSQTAITRGSVSVGSVAVELAEKIFGQLKGRTVMVIGAGDTSEKTARFLQSRGVTSILVANRTFDRAEALAAELGGRAVHWDAWEKEALQVDIMISSTSAPHYVLSRDQMQQVIHQRAGRPLFLIDLAVPRDFEPSINLLDDVYLYDIDDLQAIGRRNLKERAAEIQRSLDILRPHVRRFSDWINLQADAPESPSLGGHRQLSSA
jgi:glutamyl-tRNA reductase